MLANMREGIKKLYNTENKYDKHITFFSLLGILSIAGAYFNLGKFDIIAANNKAYIWIIMAEILWTAYFTGYEMKFINNTLNNKTDIFPEFDIKPFKAVKYLFPISVILINIFFIILSVFYENLTYLITVVVYMFITILQAGYCRNYRNNEILEPFHYFKMTDYITLLLKRFFVIIIAFLMSYGAVFAIILIAGIVILVSGFYKTHSFTEIIFTAQSLQLALTKLSIYATTILFNYFTTIGLLGWDYDLAKTYIYRQNQQNYNTESEV